MIGHNTVSQKNDNKHIFLYSIRSACKISFPAGRHDVSFLSSLFCKFSLFVCVWPVSRRWVHLYACAQGALNLAPSPRVEDDSESSSIFFRVGTPSLETVFFSLKVSKTGTTSQAVVGRLKAPSRGDTENWMILLLWILLAGVTQVAALSWVFSQGWNFQTSFIHMSGSSAVWLCSVCCQLVSLM